MRYFLTARTANGTGRYITGELIDPDIEEAGANLRRPALWNLWVDDDIPTDDVVVRYRLDELMLEDWGPSAFLAWTHQDDWQHEAVCYAEMSELVRDELMARVEQGDERPSSSCSRTVRSKSGSGTSGSDAQAQNASTAACTR